MTTTAQGGYVVKTDNLTTGSPVGGIAGSTGLGFSTGAPNSSLNDGNNRLTHRIGFTRPVYNMVFTITDLDSVANNNWDAVAVVPSAGTFGFTFPVGSQVVGAGTIASPFAISGSNSPATNNQNIGNVRITVPGPITFLDIYQWNKSPVGLGANQPGYGPYLTGATLAAAGAACP